MNKIWIKTLFFVLIFIVLVQVIMAVPAQNRTRAHDNSRHNTTQHAHAVPKQNRVQVPAPRTAPKQNKTKVTQHVNNSKKTNIPTSTDEFMDSFIGFILDIIGIVSEFQEMIADLPIIGKK